MDPQNYPLESINACKTIIDVYQNTIKLHNVSPGMEPSIILSKVTSNPSNTSNISIQNKTSNMI